MAPQTIRHSLMYPLTEHPFNPDLVTGEALRRVARAAEAAGFSGIGFTDHPAPSEKWLNAGGHDALDPFSALSFAAAVTERIRLIPNIVVLPYRNPFVVAKAAATLDRLSGGRFVLSVAPGYLRSEYRALGVDFEARNEIFDESLEVLRGVWTTDRYAYQGKRFTAGEVCANPKPGQVPIWIGGNSGRARRRVARWGDAWNPFRANPELARTARTRPLRDLDDLIPLIAELRRLLVAEGRDPESVDITWTAGLPGPGHPHFSASSHLDALADMRAVGVTWSIISVPPSLAAALEAIEQFGAEVISRQG